MTDFDEIFMTEFINLTERYEKKVSSLNRQERLVLLIFWHFHVMNRNTEMVTSSNIFYRSWVLSLTDEEIENILLMESL